MPRGDELALEQEHVGRSGEQPLDTHVNAMQGAARPVIVAAAMGRIGPDRAGTRHRAEAREHAALGTMAMENRSAGRPYAFAHAEQDGQVGRMRVPLHRKADAAEREMGREVCESPSGTLAAGIGVANDADLMTRRRLDPNEVEHMPEQAAHGCPKDVEDAQALTLVG